MQRKELEPPMPGRGGLAAREPRFSEAGQRTRPRPDRLPEPEKTATKATKNSAAAGDDPDPHLQEGGEGDPGGHQACRGGEL